MASGVNPAPFVVTGNLAGNKVGAIGMWQSKLSFAVGLVLSAGSLIAVAETEIQVGQTRQPLALSVAEFVRQQSVSPKAPDTPDALRTSPPRVTPSTGTETSDAAHVVGGATEETGERRVLSFSLVNFVEKTAAEGTAGGVPRVSLVDLVGDTHIVEGAEPVPEADTASNTGFVGGTPRDDADHEASQANRHNVVEETPGALGTSSLRAAPPVKVPDSTQFTVEQRAATGGTEALVSEAANALPLSVTGDVPAVQDSFKPFDLTEFDVEPNRLQLFDAVRSALNEHPAIAESLSRLDGQQEQVSIARAGYLPQLSSGINTGYRHTTGRSEEAFTVSASQMLYDFGKVSSAVDAATRGVDREEASVLLAAEDLIRETAQAFIQARRYEVLLELATEQIDAIAELEALATKRSAMGASSVSDQMQAKSRRESARATQLQMQAQRDQWYRALENLIGSQQQLTLDDTYPKPLEGLCPRLPENFDSAPRVVIAEAERAEAEAAIRQTRAEQRPTVSLNADFEHYLNRDTEGLQRLDDQEFVVSLNLTTNLFQGGALRARSRAAEHALYSANAARDRALLELSRLYRETRDRARSLTTSLALQDERYDSITRTQELYRHQYLSLGTRTLLDILNTEQEIFQTQVDKQNTLFDLRSLQIDCLYSVGGLREAFRAGDALNRRVLSRRAEVRS